MDKNEAKKTLVELTEERKALREKMSLLTGEAAEAEMVTRRHSAYDATKEETSALELEVKNATSMLVDINYKIKDVDSEVTEIDEQICDLNRILRVTYENTEEDTDKDIELVEKSINKVVNLLDRLTDDDAALDRYVGVIVKIAGKLGAGMERIAIETEKQTERYKTAADTQKVAA